MHPSNIEAILVTIAVSKLAIFKEVNPVQDLNIFSIFVTFAVLKFDKTKLSKFSQLSNIEPIFSTKDVSQL